MAENERIPRGVAEGEGWRVNQGEALRRGDQSSWLGEVENLSYNNPFNLELERAWFDGRIVYAADAGQLDVDIDRVKVAQEYQIVHSVQLDERGKLRKEPELVEGQFNIYDSVPGMGKYSPLWQFNYVIVGRDYRPNTFRSEKDCLESGYEILKSTVVEN